MINMEKVAVKVKRMRKKKGEEEIPLPSYMTSNSAGMDLYADIEKDIVLKPGERKLIPTGLAVDIPEGFESQIRPRSGLALKNGITLLNSPGTIDSDYRGEIGVIMINFGKESFTIKRGQRIAQMVINRICQASFELSNELSPTSRGAGGWGHTGS